MALINKIHYTYRDVTIVPGVISDIEHRSECNPFDENGFLPLFAAPMDTVVNEENYGKFIENKIYPILPRTFSLEKRLEYAVNGKWAAFSLSEFNDNFIVNKKVKESFAPIKALIDVANGHMKKILQLIRQGKEIYGDNMEIMAGNIANPKTYREYVKAGCDYVRVGIGGGEGCLSTSNTATHFPMATLIDEISIIKRDMAKETTSFNSNWSNRFISIPKYNKLTKVIADGGIRNYSDAIKALALGADYVMIGSVFAKMIESAAKKHCNSEDFIKYTSSTAILSDVENIQKGDDGWYGDYHGMHIFLGDITATFYGMASREGQIAMNGSKTKTSEGLKKSLPVLYTMKGWAENFRDYLRSAMSYTGHRTLETFRIETMVIVNSENAVNAVNK